MSQVRQAPYVRALLTSDGTPAEVDSAGYVHLTTATYVFPIGIASDAEILAIQVMTDATIVASGITLEMCNLPKGPDDASPDQRMTDWDVSSTSGWIKDDSTTNAQLQSNGTGWTATNLSMAKTAGVGIAMWNVSGRGALRYRLKAVVTTAGKMRVAVHGKSA